jgi:adenosylhomocysteinase
MPHDVKDLSLAAAGQLRIDWTELSMPVFRHARERFTTEQNRDIARLKLASMGVRIDELTPRQQEYLASWTHGT